MTDPSTGTPDSARPRVGIARGTFLGLRADVVTVISAVLVSIVVSRGLGPENRGVFFLAFAAALLIAMVGDFGMSTAGITYAASGEVAPGELHGAALGFSFVVGALAALALLPAHEFWTSEVLKGLDFTMLLAPVRRDPAADLRAGAAGDAGRAGPDPGRSPGSGSPSKSRSRCSSFRRS